MYFPYDFTLKMNWRILFVQQSTSIPNIHYECRMGCHRDGGVRFRRVFVRIEVYVAECACIESHSFQDNVMFSEDHYRSVTEIKSIVVVKIRLITTEHSEKLMIRIKKKIPNLLYRYVNFFFRPRTSHNEEIADGFPSGLHWRIWEYVISKVLR